MGAHHLTNAEIYVQSSMVRYDPIGRSHLDKNRITPVSGKFWDIILSQAVWKSSWAGGDPAQSKMATDKTVATTGIVVQAQLLTT